MGAETIAAPVLNSRSSDDEILGLTTHLPRKIVRRGSDDSSGGSTPGTMSNWIWSSALRTNAAEIVWHAKTAGESRVMGRMRRGAPQRI